MRDPVEDPATDHSDPHRDCSVPVSRDHVVDERETRCPQAIHQQAMRPGIVEKIQRSEFRVAGIDAHFFPTQQQKDGPKHIGEERRGQQYSLVKAISPVACAFVSDACAWASHRAIH